MKLLPTNEVKFTIINIITMILTTTSTKLWCRHDTGFYFLNMRMTMSITHAKSFKHQIIRSVQSPKYINSISSLSMNRLSPA